jgi:metal-responsive CopG/Arc/MetJ family transcriptional regulator
MRTVNVRLNQQQLELLDGTVTRLGAETRAEVLRQALREYARDTQAATERAGGNGTESH